MTSVWEWDDATLALVTAAERLPLAADLDLGDVVVGDVESLKPYRLLLARLAAEVDRVRAALGGDPRSLPNCTDYRSAAVALWGEAGRYAHDSYARIRAAHFPELPEQIPIVIGLTAYGGCLGLTRGGWEHGPRISLHSTTTFGRGPRYVDDVLLHECLHVWLHLTGRNPKHDSADWYTAVRRLSPAVLGRELDVTRGSDRKSVRVPNPNHQPGVDDRKTIVRKVRQASEHARVARWPYAWRPADFDYGEQIPCPTY